MICNEEILKGFLSAYSKPAERIFRAPGRVNLIGEHTDYNGGFVFPAAIQSEIKMAVATRPDTIISLYSLNFHQRFMFNSHSQLVRAEKPHTWANYFIAVVDQFRQRGFTIPGLNIAILGDVPLGAGLSSSAAYEVCTAVMFNALCNAGMTAVELALLAQSAEHSPFVGVRCGIMDQFISALGAKDHALMVDCFSLESRLVPFNSRKAAIVIVNSMKKRGLVDSEYNTRRTECEAGLATLRELAGVEFETIRHIPMSTFAQYQQQLAPTVRARVRHNLTENARVQALADALKADDWKAAGQTLYESHTSLRDDYAVSCTELDTIVEISKTIGGVYGCRMTGGGFGGCAVALVRPDCVSDFCAILAEEYLEKTGIKCAFYISKPCAGAGEEAR